MNATSNITLKVPFNEKDQAESLGARWNAELNHWYLPQGINVKPFDKWLASSPAANPTQSVSNSVIKLNTE